MATTLRFSQEIKNAMLDAIAKGPLSTPSPTPIKPMDEVQDTELLQQIKAREKAAYESLGDLWPNILEGEAYKLKQRFAYLKRAGYREVPHSIKTKEMLDEQIDLRTALMQEAGADVKQLQDEIAFLMEHAALGLLGK